MARWTYANVLNAAPGSRKFWQFSASGNFSMVREISPGESISPKLAGKNWHSLWQPKLNIAWLPSDKVFLRVLQLPVTESLSETVSMVELQLEKISPLPVAQIVWSIETLPKQEQNLQSVVVVVVPRDIVEEFLGQLEGQGYLADRLELPILDQLLATQAKEDGVWIYPGETAASPTLVAWWYGGALRNVALLSWGDGVDAARLKEQMAQMAWAGELEGWLTGTPHWHLVADGAKADAWESIVREIAGGPIQVTAPMPPAQLAASSTKRAVRAESGVNLMPPEYAARYRQQWIDRLWMRGAGMVVAVYLAGLIIYFGALQVMGYQFYRLQQEVSSYSQEYTNVVQLKQRVTLLEEQKILKFAALDSWKLISDLLPEGLTLTTFNFQKGKTVMLGGTVAQENVSSLTDYYEALTKASFNGKPMALGNLVTPPASPGPSGIPIIRWSFTCTLPAK